MTGKFLSSPPTDLLIPPGHGAALNEEKWPPSPHKPNGSRRNRAGFRWWHRLFPSAGTTSQRMSIACSVMVIFLGGLTLLGWITGLEELASLRHYYIPMAPSTALAFVLLGIAVILRARHDRSRTLAGIFTACVGLMALSKLAESVSGHSFGLDELFVSAPEQFGQVRKGRMAPITAFNFALAASALASELCTLS